ncbi:MAG: hypothetical protein JNL79_07040 [Myxococcales bacterium]|nr:hypothetical protein [Myxococcales bacterium]
MVARASLALALAALATSAAASPTRVVLDWESAPSCLDAIRLGAAVEATLGRPAFCAPGSCPARIEGRVRRVEGRYEAVVRAKRPDGTTFAERTLTTEGACHQLDDALVVVVALLVEEVTTDEGKATPVHLRLPKPLAPVEAQTPAAPTSVFGGFGVSLACGLSPGCGPAVLVSAGLRVSPFEVGLGVRAEAGRRALSSGVGAELTTTSLLLAGCYAPSLTATLDLPLCAALGVGNQVASPIGLASADPRSAVIVLASASVGARLRLFTPWLHLRADVGLDAPLASRTWVLAEPGGGTSVLHRAGLGPAFTIGLQLL